MKNKRPKFSREKRRAKEDTPATKQVDSAPKAQLPISAATLATTFAKAIKSEEVPADDLEWEHTYVVIFSRTFVEARECVSKLNVPEDRWVFLRGADVLLAYEGHKKKRVIVWRYGEYYKRQNLLDIEKIIEARGLLYEDAPL